MVLKCINLSFFPLSLTVANGQNKVRYLKKISGGVYLCPIVYILKGGGERTTFICLETTHQADSSCNLILVLRILSSKCTKTTK